MAELSTDERNAIIAVAQRLADAARKETLAHFRGAGLQTENKSQHHFDPVTEADRAAETAMRHLLAELRPQDSILGEEFGFHEGESDLTWVLDPIDGTRGYMSGTPTWGVLIALCGPEGPLFGIIDQPYTAERFMGGFGLAEMHGPHGNRRLDTRETATLDRAVLFSTFPEVGTDVERSAFHTLASQVKLTRYGMDCYAYALLALGQIDLVVEAGLQPYDIQAPIAVVEAAGGIVTDWQGNPAHQGGRVLAAGNTQLHAAALDILSQVPAG